MSTPPPILKTQPNKGRPPKITLEILYDYMESGEKRRRRERCQNPNRVRNIKKNEGRKRHKTPNRARGND
jgi:hypothetical protein